MMAAGKKKSEEKKSDEKKSDTTDKEHLLRDNAEKQLANFPVVSPKLKGQTAEKLIHELQVHQIELETQAEELQRTHLELQESRDKYIDLYDFAPIVYLTLNDKAVITEANLTGALLLGVVRRKLIKTQFRKFIVPKYLDHWDRLFFNMIRTGESQSFDLELMQSDGTTFPARLDCIRIKKSGELLTIRIAISEITRQKEAEAAIRESEERFWHMFSKIPLPYQSLDAEGRLLEVSPQWSETFGYTREEVIGHRFEDFVAPENREMFLTVFEKYKVSGAVSNIEFLMRKKDGSNLRVIYTGRIGHNPDGSFQQTYCILEDVTIRRQNEEALKEIHTRHSLLLKQAHDMIFIHEITENGPGKFLEVNDKICTLLGYTREELLEMDVSDINVPEQNKKIPGLLKNLFSNHNVTFETQFFTKDGRRLPVEISAALFDLRGRQTVLAIGRDITDRKQAEAALRETNKKLKLLSSITRHDINNQLTVLRGYLTILEKKQPDPALNEYFEKLTTAAERISAMILFTREYEQIGIIAPVWQNCRKIIDRAVKEVHLGKVTVNNDLPASAEVFADPLFVKVCYNLTDNAVRYGGKITTIHFFVQESGDAYILVCEDDGDGVPAEEKEKIFTRGFGKNTGLGLFISQEILDITGITIKETGEPGKGARFEMTVPKGMWRTAGTGG